MGKRPRFSCIPRALLENPPIYTPGRQGRWLLSPLHMAILAGILALARPSLASERHGRAFAVGGKAIAREGADKERYAAELGKANAKRRQGEKAPLPMRHHTYRDATYKPHQARMAMKRAGKKGYERARKKLRSKPAPAQELITTRYALLRAAGLSDNAANRRELENALYRFAQPVIIAGMFHARLFNDIEALPGSRRGDKLRLSINGDWLPPNRYQRIHLPLPTSSPYALALYLFLHAIDTRPHVESNPHIEENRIRAISLQSIAEKLGIGEREGWEQQRAVRRALAAINKHLESHGSSLHYEIRVNSSGLARFIHVKALDYAERLQRELQCKSLRELESLLDGGDITPEERKAVQREFDNRICSQGARLE